MKPFTFRRFALALVLGSACESSVDDPSGLFEPIVVHEAQLQTEAPAQADAAVAPKVLSLETTSQILLNGQRGRTLGGRVSASAYAVAVRVVNQGSNWWILPTGSLDPDFPEQRTFALDFDVGTSLPAGAHELALAAVDENGALGEASTLAICVMDDAQPANFNLCDATQKPPALAINLQWNTNVDLDLIVVTPSGEVLAWKTPGTVEKDGQKPLGRLLRDSNPHCVLDRRNSESVIFDKSAPPGSYLIYVDFVAACGESGVLFSTQVQRAVARTDTTFGQDEIHRNYGAFIAQQATNFPTSALYVGTFDAL